MEKKKYYIFFFITFFIATYPGVAHAHDLFTFVFLPSLIGFIFTALIAAAVKYGWVSRMIQCPEENNPKLYVVIAFLEIFIMGLSFPLAYHLTPSQRDTLTLLFITGLIYSIIGVIPNIILIRKVDQWRGLKSSLFVEISKSYLFTLIFPALALIVGISMAIFFFGF